nr:EAL domain-containing protein [uncultured Dorea sp.]
MAYHLDMKVIAEGVEMKEQADFLKNYGCDYLQGFYFSKAVSEEEFEKLLDSQPGIVI